MVLTAGVVVHAGLREHGVVLNLRLPNGRAVVADDDQLGCNQSCETPRHNAAWRSEEMVLSLAGADADDPLQAKRCRCRNIAYTFTTESEVLMQSCTVTLNQDGRRTLAGAQALDGSLGAQRELAGLHDQSQAGVDALQTSLLLQTRTCQPKLVMVWLLQ